MGKEGLTHPHSFFSLPLWALCSEDLLAQQRGVVLRRTWSSTLHTFAMSVAPPGATRRTPSNTTNGTPTAGGPSVGPTDPCRQVPSITLFIGLKRGSHRQRRLFDLFRPRHGTSASHHVRFPFKKKFERGPFWPTHRVSRAIYFRCSIGRHARGQVTCYGFLSCLL